MAIIISDDNRGPIVNIVAWFGTGAIVIAVCIRIGCKCSVARRCSMEDAFIVAALFLSSVMSIAITFMVANGLGELQSTLTSHQIRNFQKAGYASQLLYIPALCFAKLSTLVYLRSLSPDARFAYINLFLEAFVVLWGLSAEFAIAFQCQMPFPWAIISGKCFNTVPFWIVNGGFDTLTDIAIILLPTYLVWPLQMSRERKCAVVVVFGSRILIIPLTVWRVCCLSTTSSPSAPDQTFSLFEGYLATTIQLNFAIFVGCVPFLKSIMENMSSGGLASKVHPINSSRRGSKLSSLISNTLASSSRKSSTPRERFQMESLSESRLNEDLKASRMYPDVPSAHNNISHPNTPSIYNDQIQFVIESPGDHINVETFRPDKVSTINNIRHSPVPLDESMVDEVRHPGGGDKLAIRRTTEWNVVHAGEKDQDGLCWKGNDS